MRLFGLIGYPLSHSFSKFFFTEKFDKEGLSDCQYENFPIASIDELDTVLSKKDLQGFNVTIPYKAKVIPFLHFVSEEVKEMGACNCIKINEGKLFGYNTDIVGFKESLLKKFDPAIHTRALILGTGGSSKAVSYVLNEIGVPFSYVSRISDSGDLTYEQVTRSIIEQNKLIINTTPVGMFPNIDDAPAIPYETISKDHFLFDLIYNPEKTLFLQKGEVMGAQIQNGYEMLILQAEAGWEIWNSDDMIIDQ